MVPIFLANYLNTPKAFTSHSRLWPAFLDTPVCVIVRARYFE